MSQRFFQGRTNNHLTWVMVDATNYADPESAVEDTTKIKIYGKLQGQTGVYFVSSGTGSLTNSIVHVGASALGIYTIALQKPDLSDASAAWYDQYVVSLSATGCAYQTIIAEGVLAGANVSSISAAISDLDSALTSQAALNASSFSDILSLVVVANSAASDAYSAAAQANSRVLLVQSRLSDLDSRLVSDISDVYSAAQQTNSRALVIQSMVSDVDSALASQALLNLSSFSDIYSAAQQTNSRTLVIQSLVSDIDSALTSQFTAGHPLNVSDLSDLRSAITAAAADASLCASDLSDLRSAITAAGGGTGATASQVWTYGTRTLTSAAAATITVSDISDIASRVQAVLASDLSDILSAAQQANSRTLVVQSLVSDVDSALTSQAALNASSFSDIYSLLNSVDFGASAMSDLRSAISDCKSAAAQANSRALVIQSMVSDVDSALTSQLALSSSSFSDIYSLLSNVNSVVGAIDTLTKAGGDGDLAAILTDTGTTLDGVVDAIKAKTDNLTFTSGNDLDVNVQKINDVALTGTGTSAVPWGPA